MKLKDLSQEELETMSYSEITSVILTEKGSKMKIVDVFKKICTALNLNEQEYENKIADFFELISTDKDFIVLEKGFCDLRTKHNSAVVIEDEEISDIDSAESEEDIEETEDEIIDEDEDIFYDDTTDDDLPEPDELEDFDVVDDEEASI